jgi:hypothetical protein
MTARVPNHTVVQNAWVVSDLRASICRLSRDLGYGPWLLLQDIHLPLVLHDGRPTAYRHTSALCQAGAVQVELAMLHDDLPSAFVDMYPRPAAGFHHTAMFVEDFAAAVGAYQDAGYSLVQHMHLPGGRQSGFVDTRRANGHMLEVLEDSAGLRALYALVAGLGRQHGCDEIIEADGDTLTELLQAGAGR